MSRLILLSPIVLMATIFVVVLPVLEIGPTHLTHPQWPGHARLHEAWQLLTHASLSLFVVWLAFRRGEVAIASGIGLCLTVPFLLAFLLQGLYGGTLSHVDGGEVSLAGSAAVPLLGLISAGLLRSAWVARARGGEA